MQPAQSKRGVFIFFFFLGLFHLKKSKTLRAEAVIGGERATGTANDATALRAPGVGAARDAGDAGAADATGDGVTAVAAGATRAAGGTRPTRVGAPPKAPATPAAVVVAAVEAT